MDAKVDKDLKIGGKGKSNGLYLNIYLLVQNLLDAKNVLGVYAFTGNPDDDGYIASATGQSNASNQLDPTAFELLYGIKVNNPGNYSLARRIHLGAILNF